MQNKKVFISLFLTSVLVFAFFLGTTKWNVSPFNSQNEVSAQRISTCLNRTNIPETELHWIYVPENASQLHTEENYFFLAGQLIKIKAVDASTCPSEGLALNGYANACGMSVAKEAVIYIQNSMDQAILDAWVNVGVPPVMLKQMIRTESQFWPGEYQQIHYGFGHITNIGLRNALEWNQNLYAKVCPASAGGTCASSYTIANEILSSLIVTCPTCQYGINLEQAERSVDILAEVVLGYCYQTAQVINNATQWHSSDVVDYPTIWKLTLLNYNAGPKCVYDAVRAAFLRNNGPVQWSDVVYQVSGNDQCIRGVTYANQITAKYFDFPPK